jgi:hypothetical protein
MATTLRPTGAQAGPARPLLPGLAVAAVATVIAVAAAVVLPDITTAGRMTGTPTHYMGLLMANQPWNLLIFMVVPFVLIYGGLVPPKLGLAPPSVERLVTPVPQLVALLGPRARPRRDELRHARPIRAWLGRSGPRHALRRTRTVATEARSVVSSNHRR